MRRIGSALRNGGATVLCSGAQPAGATVLCAGAQPATLRAGARLALPATGSLAALPRAGVLLSVLRAGALPAVLRAAALAALCVAPIADAADATGDAARGAALFRERCALCHDTAGAAGQGPGLGGIVGRRAGSGRFAYSEALRGSGLVWQPETLERFLAAPAQLVPGTSMPVDVPELRDRHDLVAYLSTLAAASDAAGAAATTGTGTGTGTGTSTGAFAGATATAGPDSGASAAAPASASPVFADWRADAPGRRHRIAPGDLPAPYREASATNGARVVPRPAEARLQVPPGFELTPYASGLDRPRVLRVAPNGDLFVAETFAGRIRVLRGGERAQGNAVWAEHLDRPFGLAFHPAHAPRWLYVANSNAILRYPYRSGDMAPAGPAQVVVPRLIDGSGGHNTRDIAFSPDGRRLYVAVGSGSNAAEGLRPNPPAAIRAFEAAHGLGATWENETGRADVLSFDPDGGDRRVVATGLRNCAGLAVQAATGALWCTTNERDGLGDDLVPDYVTRVRDGAFYGWPWYYIGANPDPRHAGERPELAAQVALPDVLLQPHSAPLQIAFYEATAGAALFPPAYRGDAFVALHGSWNRSRRTGYKLVRIPLRDGVPAGDYEDFMTGFVVDDASVWGRPVGVAVAADGALIVSEDAGGTLWRIAPVKR